MSLTLEPLGSVMCIGVVAFICYLLWKESQRNTCEWKQDADGNWDTECGQTFCLTEGHLIENHMNFCHHCGRKLVEVKFIETKEGK